MRIQVGDRVRCSISGPVRVDGIVFAIANSKYSERVYKVGLDRTTTAGAYILVGIRSIAFIEETTHDEMLTHPCDRVRKVALRKSKRVSKT